MRFVILSLLFLSIACNTSTEYKSISSKTKLQFDKLTEIDSTHYSEIFDSKEGVEPLFLSLKFVNRDTGEILTHQQVNYYHTSSSGDYEPSVAGDESTARYNGSAITDKTGQIYIKTILPGNYSSRGDNRHIHTTVIGARPETYDIHFKQYSDLMDRFFIHRSDQHFMADLVQLPDSSLFASVKIEVKFN